MCIEASLEIAIDCSRVALRGLKTKSGAGGAGIGSYLAGGLLFGVVGLGAVVLAGRSHNAKIPAGTSLTCFVDRDISVEVVPAGQEAKMSHADGSTAVTSVKSDIASENVESKNQDVKVKTED